MQTSKAKSIPNEAKFTVLKNIAKST